MNPLKKLASQTAIYGLSSIVGRFLNFLLAFIHTRVFAKAEFGIISELYSYVAFLIILLTYGMETSFFNFSKYDPGDTKPYSTALISLITSTAFFVTIALVAAPSLGEIYYGHTDYILCFIFIVASDALTAIPFARLRQQNKAKLFVGIRLANIGINIVLNLLFLIVFPMIGWYDKGIGIGYIFLANFAASMATLLLMIPQFNIKYEFDKALWKKMFHYALPIAIAGLPGMINETLDRSIMRYLLPDGVDKMANLGVYGAVYKIAMIMTMVVQAYRFAAEPFFFSDAKNSKENLAKSTHYFTILCLIIFLGINFYLDIVKGFIGEQFHEGLFIVPILLFANLCLGVYINLSMWFKLSEKTMYGIYFSVFGALITIIANVILVPRIGYAGAAWATLTCYASMMILCYIVGQKKFPVNYDIRSFLLYVSIAMILFFLSRYFETNMWVNTILLGIFVGILWLKERKNLSKRYNI